MDGGGCRHGRWNLERNEDMIFIIGGAYQGKLVYAKKLCPGISWIDGKTCREEEIYDCGGIYHFHNYIERLMQAGKPVKGLAGEIADRNPDIVIVSDEIGYGIVPVEAFDREYREMTGRICTELAVYADKVCRVVCGIGMEIKG